MKAETQYSPEVRERAVRMVLDQQNQHASQWAAMVVIADAEPRLFAAELSRGWA